MTVSILEQPAAVAPFAMSAAALALVIGQVAIVGTAPQPDEGAAAHLWQMLMAAQIPFIAILAALPVFLLGW